MKPEEFNSKVLPMRQELKCYALKLSGNDDDAEDSCRKSCSGSGTCAPGWRRRRAA